MLIQSKKRRVFIPGFICLMLLMFLVTSCGMRIVKDNAGEDNVELEDGSLYEFSVKDGIFFEHDKLTLLKKFNYAPEEDVNLTIRASGDSGSLAFYIEGSELSEEVQWTGDDLDFKLPIVKGDNIEVTIDAVEHSGKFEITEEGM